MAAKEEAGAAPAATRCSFPLAKLRRPPCPIHPRRRAARCASGGGPCEAGGQRLTAVDWSSDASHLLATHEPDAARSLQRASADYDPLPERRGQLLLKERSYQQQYANIYFQRLVQLKP